MTRKFKSLWRKLRRPDDDLFKGNSSSAQISTPTADQPGISTVATDGLDASTQDERVYDPVSDGRRPARMRSQLMPIMEVEEDGINHSELGVNRGEHTDTIGSVPLLPDLGPGQPLLRPNLRRVARFTDDYDSFQYLDIVITFHISPEAVLQDVATHALEVMNQNMRNEHNPSTDNGPQNGTSSSQINHLEQARQIPLPRPGYQEDDEARLARYRRAEASRAYREQFDPFDDPYDIFEESQRRDSALRSKGMLIRPH